MLKDRLTSLRKEQKKTQEDIAQVVGVTRPAYTAYERGTRTPDYKVLETLADYYAVNTDYLLGRTKTKNTGHLSDQDMVEQDMAKRLKSLLTEIEEKEGLLFDGEPMSEDMKKFLLESIEHMYRQVQLLHKKI